MDYTQVSLSLARVNKSQCVYIKFSNRYRGQGKRAALGEHTVTLVPAPLHAELDKQTDPQTLAVVAKTLYYITYMPKESP